MIMKKIMSACLLLLCTHLVAKDFTLQSQPSLLCSDKAIRDLLKTKLNVDVLKVTFSERAGHVNFYDVTLPQTAFKQKDSIRELIDQYCMHVKQR